MLFAVFPLNSRKKHSTLFPWHIIFAGVGTSICALFNAGGHINHSIFWTTLAPIGKGGGEGPGGELAQAIEETFGSFEAFKEKCTALAVGIQGSGWGWLAYDPVLKRLVLAQCANQDPLQAVHGLIPLFGIDVWEHAYYLQYKSARAEYVKNIWKIVHWKNVEERFAKAKNG